jgi:hypothetical protein
MSELERQLRALGTAVELPPVPPLAASVATRLETERRRRPAVAWRPLSRRTALLAAALVLLLAGTVVAAVPGARDAVLEFVGLRGGAVERVRTLPAGTEARPGLGLGRSFTSVEAAAPVLAFEPLLPAGDEPDGVFVAHPPPGGQLSLTYPPGPGLPRSRYTGVGLLVNEVRGDFAPGFYGKMAPRGVRIERLEIAGRPAIWVEGLHRFQYFDRDHGYFRIERARLAANTLLYQHGRVLVRIEGELSLEEATAVARGHSR